MKRITWSSVGKASITIILVLTMGILLTSCIDTYDETDAVAESTWPLMTAQEKIIYDKVEDGWGQSSLKYLRERIRQRELKPNDNEIQFADMPALIKSVNNSFAFGSNDNDSTKAAKTKARFHMVDPKWYRKMLIMIGEDEEEDIQHKSIHQEIIEFDEPPKTRIKEKQKQPMVVMTAKVEEKLTDILTSDEIFDLKTEIGSCDPAISIVQIAATKNNPLTKADESDIMYEISICETKRLSDSLND